VCPFLSGGGDGGGGGGRDRQKVKRGPWGENGNTERNINCCTLLVLTGMR